MSVMRIGHVNLRVMDLDAARHHYEDVLGLIPTHQDASGNVYLKGWDEWDKYSVVLSKSDRAGMNHVAYKVEHDADLDVFQTRIAAYGIDVEEVPPGHLECCGRALRFKLPERAPDVPLRRDGIRWQSGRHDESCALAGRPEGLWRPLVGSRLVDV